MTTKREDINGRVIQEGDTVRFTSLFSLDRKEGEVIYDSYGCSFHIVDKKVITSSRGREGTNYQKTFYFIDVKDIEVIN